MDSFLNLLFGGDEREDILQEMDDLREKEKKADKLTGSKQRKRKKKLHKKYLKLKERLDLYLLDIYEQNMPIKKNN